MQEGFVSENHLHTEKYVYLLTASLCLQVHAQFTFYIVNACLYHLQVLICNCKVLEKMPDSYVQMTHIGRLFYLELKVYSS